MESSWYKKFSGVEVWTLAFLKGIWEEDQWGSRSSTEKTIHSCFDTVYIFQYKIMQTYRKGLKNVTIKILCLKIDMTDPLCFILTI